MGEIGGNDYNHALSAGKSVDEIEAYVPFVIKAIISTINVSMYSYKQNSLFIFLTLLQS